MTAISPVDNVSRSLIRWAPPAPLEPGPDEFDLLSGVRLIRRRVGMIVLLSVLLTAAFIPLIAGMKPVYHAESRLMIHAPLAATLDTGDQRPDIPLTLASETERLLSRDIAVQVIGALHLADRQEFNPALGKPSLLDRARALLHPSRGGSAPASDGIERIIPQFYRALSVQRDGSSDVVRIGFDSRDPELAAAVPNALIGIYLKQRERDVRGRLDAAQAWIRQRIDQQQQRLDAARAAADRYRQADGLASSDAQAAEIRAIVDLGAQQASLTERRGDLAATLSTLKAWRAGDALPSGIVLPDSAASVQRDLSLQQHTLDGLLQTYGDNAKEVIDLRAKIAGSKAALAFEVDRFVQTQQAKLAALDRQQNSLRSSLSQARARLSRSAEMQAGLARVEHTVEREQAVLDKLDQQRQELAARAALPAVEAEVLSPASVPLRPQGRGRLFYLLGAMLVAGSIAVTAAFLREMLDSTVRSQDQLERFHGTSRAGLTPRLHRRDQKNLSDLLGHSRGGLFSEAVRATIISLKRSNGGKLPDSVVVTSAYDGEGKSLVARALAIELAATGHKVLLVDGDLQRGSLDTFFPSESKAGLNEFLSGEAGLADIVHHDAESGLSFIPRGNAVPGRRPRLSGVAPIMAMARSNGQFVIFDSASVLASTDTSYLAAVADRMLLVVQWAKTHRRAVECAVRRLNGANNTDVLIAMNKVDPYRHALYDFKDSELFSKPLRKCGDISV